MNEETKKASYDELTDALKMVEISAEHGFFEIAAIANLALTSLESVSGSTLFDIARALDVIKSLAEGSQTAVEYTVSEVSDNYINPKLATRFTAYNAMCDQWRAK